MTILPLLPLEASFTCQFLSSVVDCAVGFNHCLEFLSTTRVRVTHSAVALWSLLSLSVLGGRNVSMILLQPAGASFILLHSLLVPIMGSAVGVEIGDASPWRCWLPLDKWSSSIDRYFLLTHECSYGVGWVQISRYVSVGVSVLVSKREMLLRGDVDICFPKDVEVLIVAGWWVVDDSVVEYLSTLETLRQCSRSNWRQFSEGRCSIQASPRKFNAVDCGSLLATSQVDEWCCHHICFRVKVHTVWLLIMLPQPHSWGVLRFCESMATIATADLSGCPNHILSLLSRTNHHAPQWFGSADVSHVSADH